MYIWRAKHHLSPSDQIITYLRLSFVLREGTDVASSIFKFDSRAEGFHRAIPQYHMSHASHVCKTVGRRLVAGEFWTQWFSLSLPDFARPSESQVKMVKTGAQAESVDARWVAHSCTMLHIIDISWSLQYFAILCNTLQYASCIILHHFASSCTESDLRSWREIA